MRQALVLIHFSQFRFTRSSYGKGYYGLPEVTRVTRNININAKRVSDTTARRRENINGKTGKTNTDQGASKCIDQAVYNTVCISYYCIHLYYHKHGERGRERGERGGCLYSLAFTSDSLVSIIH